MKPAATHRGSRDLLGARWQPRQHERQSPQQGAVRSARGRRLALPFPTTFYRRHRSCPPSRAGRRPPKVEMPTTAYVVRAWMPRKWLAHSSSIVGWLIAGIWSPIAIHCSKSATTSGPSWPPFLGISSPGSAWRIAGSSKLCGGVSGNHRHPVIGSRPHSFAESARAPFGRLRIVMTLVTVFHQDRPNAQSQKTQTTPAPRRRASASPWDSPARRPGKKRDGT